MLITAFDYGKIDSFNIPLRRCETGQRSGADFDWVQDPRLKIISDPRQVESLIIARTSIHLLSLIPMYEETNFIPFRKNGNRPTPMKAERTLDLLIVFFLAGA